MQPTFGAPVPKAVFRVTELPEPFSVAFSSPSPLQVDSMCVKVGTSHPTVKKLHLTQPKTMDLWGCFFL